ncbi:MAG TPA: hypothetical protein VII43_04935 [Opitutaceae bacterium]
MNSQDPDRLEAAIHRVLRSVPDRKAPAGMELRILAELSRRAALPWWRKSYAYWPLAFRATFFVGSAVAAALLVSGLIALGRSTGGQDLAGGVAQPFAWLSSGRSLVESINANFRQLIAMIPPVWLYGVVGTIALCYAALAVIGAAAYRALSFGRQPL